MDDIVSRRVSSSTERHQYLIKCFVGMNMLDHKLFGELLTKCVEDGESLPISSLIGRDLVPRICEEKKSKHIKCFKDIDIAIIVDETTDIENLSV